MTSISVSAERPISAPAERVYQCIADFNQHHHRFLPPAFSDFQVEQGGYGAGTVNRFHIKLGWRDRVVRTHVEEPDPGRVLRETDREAGNVTTFTVTPSGGGCTARIEMTWPAAKGIAGIFERLFAPRIVRNLFDDELERLDRYAQSLSTSAP